MRTKRIGVGEVNDLCCNYETAADVATKFKEVSSGA